MIDNVRSEHRYALFIGHLLSVRFHLHVEGKNGGVQFIVLEHRRRLHDVSLVHVTYVDAAKLKINKMLLIIFLIINKRTRHTGIFSDLRKSSSASNEPSVDACT